MAGGYELDPQALKKVEKGINDAMEELKEFGFDIHAELGHGFSDMELKGLEVGSAELTEVFADFCDRWGWGVHGLMQDANEVAQALHLNAGMYHEQEEYVSDVLKTVAVAGVGNPGLSQEEIEGRSLEESLSEAARPDYSMESVQRGAGSALGSWQQTGEDAATSPWTAAPGHTDHVELQWDGPPGAEEAEEAAGDRGADGGGGKS